MKNNFWKYFSQSWLRKDLYLEQSKGEVLSRSRNDFAPFYINHTGFVFVLALVSMIGAVITLICISSVYHLNFLMITIFALMALGFTIAERAGMTSDIIRELREKKRNEEKAFRDERLKKSLEKRDAKKHQEENVLQKLSFTVVQNGEPIKTFMLLPSSVAQALTIFSDKFTAVDARTGVVSESELAELDKVATASINSVIWYDGLSEKHKEMDSARTVELCTALNKASTFLDDFDKKIDEELTKRMKENIEVINSVELDSTSQKLVD